MDTKDSAENTAHSAAPAKPGPKPRPGEPEPEETVPSVPLNGREDDSLEGMGAAFSGLHVHLLEKEKEKEAMDLRATEDDPGGVHDPSGGVPFDDKPSGRAPRVSERPAAPLPSATTPPATHPATSSPTTSQTMAEGLGFTGMPYPTHGVDPVATAPPMATAVSEPAASSSTYTGIHESMPGRYAEDYHRPPTGVGPTFLPGSAAPEPGDTMPAPR